MGQGENRVTCGIYLIRNVANDHFYVGSSRNIEWRVGVHSRGLDSNHHHSRYLQNAYNKYGLDNFEYEILTVCDIDSLLSREQEFIDKLHPQYNVSPFASCPPGNKGKKLSEEHKRKISLSLIGNKYFAGHKFPEEAKRKLSKAMKGRKLSEEHKKKLSDARKRRPSSPNKGHKMSEESKSKMSMSHKGCKNPHIGHKHTEEWKKKMSERMKGNQYTLGKHWSRRDK